MSVVNKKSVWKALNSWGLALGWEVRNRAYRAVGRKLWSTAPQLDQTSLVSERFLQIGDLYHQLNNQPCEILSLINRRIRKLGICYGIAMAMVDRLIHDPSLTGAQVLAWVKHNPEHCLLYQALEVIRGEAIDNAALGESLSATTSQLCPQPDNSVIFDFAEQSLYSFTQLVRGSECLLLIRAWSVGQTTSHAFVCRASETHRHYWFYHLKQGLYGYPSQEALEKAFMGHLYAFFPKTIAPGGFFKIDIYAVVNSKDQGNQGDLTKNT